jgi:hypothetical protein
VVTNGDSANGHHPERGRDIAQGNGANGPAPMHLHESELDVTEQED